MPLPSPTVEELVAALRRSALPTVLVEGQEDMRIYRWVEERLGNRAANVLPTGGRENLLSVFRRRQEFADLPVAFVADRDMLLFSGIPTDYDEIIWTEGYSIENDLYADADLENLLAVEESQEHLQLREAIVEWFAFEVEEYLAGRKYKISYHCNDVVMLGQTQMGEDFINCCNFRTPGEEIHRQVRDAYQLQLRGKLLFQMLIRFLSAPDRQRKYSYSDLYDRAFGMTPPHPLRNRLVEGIEQTIAEQKAAIPNAKQSQ